ncbi:hypothetical protein GCM10010302_22680 [Streptomyces polychromogenes]|uniref:Uncharacterized protein n=1 Tax=Streptomyces polychromogenes TaxID=67342 RepID=A0ABN0VAZ1_9ACTN
MAANSAGEWAPRSRRKLELGEWGDAAMDAASLDMLAPESSAPARMNVPPVRGAPRGVWLQNGYLTRDPP